jgi:hypothetical protein
VAISVTDPIGLAFDRTVRMLFKPFSASKWFTLGFCAWLAQLGEGGSGNFNFPRGGGGGGRRAPGSTPDLREAFKTFVFDNAYWIVPLVILVLVLVVVLIWLRARGKFMFLEGVAYDRAAVVEPWKRLRPPANAYFRFELLLGVLMLAAMLAVAALSYAIALPDIEAQQFRRAAITALVVGISLILLVALVWGLIQTVAQDFLIPLMYLRGGSVGAAWGEFRRVILRGNLGPIVLFYLMRIVLGLAAGMLMFLGVCLTCLIAAIPYLGTVLFLPIFVFNRSYSLYFLRQFGNEYNLLMEWNPPTGFPVIMPSPAPPPADV